jgi:hypothetical protein
LTIATGTTWLLTGADSLGRKLIEALTSDDDDSKTLAGMYLVKGGERGRRLVVDALEKGAEAPELVTVLQSLGGPEAEAALADLAEHEERPLAGQARRALNELTEIRRRREPWAEQS